MYQVSVYLRNHLVEVARHRYDSLASALLGRVELMKRFVRGQGMKVRVTSVRRISHE